MGVWKTVANNKRGYKDYISTIKKYETVENSNGAMDEMIEEQEVRLEWFKTESKQLILNLKMQI